VGEEMIIESREQLIAQLYAAIGMVRSMTAAEFEVYKEACFVYGQAVTESFEHGYCENAIKQIAKLTEGRQLLTVLMHYDNADETPETPFSIYSARKESS
jgi:hypothetical protein